MNLQIIAPDGRSIALRNVIELETETGATQIHRRNQQRINTLSIDVAGRVRLRPILMTMLTTVLALLPLALGYGEGGEAQASLARVVVGGLISSSLITLIVIPAVFSFRRSTHHQKSIS